VTRDDFAQFLFPTLALRSPLGRGRLAKDRVLVAALRHGRQQVDDIVAAALDQTQPLGRRRLGRRVARRIIIEAARKGRQILTLASPAAPAGGG
jgi:hypothetical protein